LSSPVFAADLAQFAGAPFTDDAVAIAVADVQAACRWHIAPQVSETVVVDTPEQFDCNTVGPRLLQLPTLNLVSVTAVRDVTDPANPVAVTDYLTAQTRDFKAGLLARGCGYWSLGSVYEVDMVHGYVTWPPDLLAAVAEAAQDQKINRASGTVRVGAVSMTPGVVSDTSPRVLNRYRLTLVP
jgi:hypothetical protein